MNEGQRISRVLNAISTIVKQLSNDSIEAIINGTVVICLELVPKKGSESELISINFNSTKRNDIVKKLKDLKSREECEAYLRGLKLTKKDLFELCKAIDLPYSTKDSNEFLIHKIIDNTIGYKLRSDAIRKGGLHD